MLLAGDLLVAGPESGGLSAFLGPILDACVVADSAEIEPVPTTGGGGREEMK